MIIFPAPFSAATSSAADIDIYRSPFPAFSRQIYMIARTAEFGDLPDQLAADCRELLSDKVIPRFRDIVPELKDTIEIIAPQLIYPEIRNVYFIKPEPAQ